MLITSICPSSINHSKFNPRRSSTNLYQTSQPIGITSSWGLKLSVWSRSVLPLDEVKKNKAPGTTFEKYEKSSLAYTGSLSDLILSSPRKENPNSMSNLKNFLASDSEDESTNFPIFSKLPTDKSNLETFIDSSERETLKTNFTIQGESLLIMRRLKDLLLGHRNEFNVQSIVLQKIDNDVKLYLHFGKHRKYMSWLTRFFPNCILSEPVSDIRNFRTFGLKCAQQNGNKFFQIDALREVYNYLADKLQKHQTKQRIEEAKSKSPNQLKKRQLNDGRESKPMPEIFESADEEEKSETIRSESRSEDSETLSEDYNLSEPLACSQESQPSNQIQRTNQPNLGGIFSKVISMFSLI